MILRSRVPRSLEKKARIFGFELGDLLLIFLYLALSNLLFGQTKLKPLLVWGGTLGLGSVIYFIKRGKPDGYLQHYGEFLTAPSIYSAGTGDLEYRPYFLSEDSIHENESKV